MRDTPFCREAAQPALFDLNIGRNGAPPLAHAAVRAEGCVRGVANGITGEKHGPQHMRAPKPVHQVLCFAGPMFQRMGGRVKDSWMSKHG